MSMIAPKSEGTRRELVPAGNHIGRLYEITYIGTINSGYKDDNGDDKYQYRVRLTWELPGELRKFGEDEVEKPMVISKEMNFSLYKSEKMTAVLRTVAHSLLGVTLTDKEADTFDIDQLLGKACMVEVAHESMRDTGKVFAKVVGFGSLPKGVAAPDQVNESRVVSVHDLKQEEIEQLPEFIRNKMMASKEYEVRFLAPRSEQPKTDLPQAVEDAQEITPEGIPF